MYVCMDQSLLLLSEHFLSTMRGALMMLFIGMCLDLYSKRDKNPILSFLFQLLILLSLFLLVSFGFMFEPLKRNELFNTFNTLFDLCLVPLIGSFLLKVILPNRLTTARIIVLLAPTIACVIIHAITHSKVVLFISSIYTVLVAIVLFSLIMVFSHRYDKRLKNHFSDINNKTVRWVRIVTFLFAFWFVIWGFILQQNSRWFESAYYLFLIVVWIFIYKYSIRHVITLPAEELLTPMEGRDTENIPAKTVNDAFIPKLEYYMTQESLWQNSSLTLQDLATILNTNRTYISRYFNQTLNTTFYDYLNKFRIEHACNLLLSQPDLPLPQVSEESGFSSLSTFHRVFSRYTGYSPSRYRNEKQHIPSKPTA